MTDHEKREGVTPKEAAEKEITPFDERLKVKDEREMGEDDPRRKENRPMAGVIPTRGQGPALGAGGAAGGAAVAVTPPTPRPVLPGPTTGGGTTGR